MLFEDTGSLGYLELDGTTEVQPMTIEGLVHSGAGTFNGADKLDDGRYLLYYNIDGVSWLYEAALDEASMTMEVKHIITGQGQIVNIVVPAENRDRVTMFLVAEDLHLSQGKITI